MRRRADRRAGRGQDVKPWQRTSEIARRWHKRPSSREVRAHRDREANRAKIARATERWFEKMAADTQMKLPLDAMTAR